MKKIRWGIIGCGDVTEIKSGPAFNLINNSELIAVMRRDEGKAKDYAIRHKVPKWYCNANELINDKDVNAIYIATPPSSHEEYSIAAIHAGKPVYVEKPMSTDAASSKRISDAAKNSGIKLSVAHYRRGQPYFNKIKDLLNAGTIGQVKFIQLTFNKKLLSSEELHLPGNKWRVNAAISGGGLFHDLAPHQLDILYYFFGDAEYADGIAINQSRQYNAHDVVTGNMLYANDVFFNGAWRFNATAADEKDVCIIYGINGKITFSFFGEQTIVIEKGDAPEIISFTPPRHVQQPMIEKVVKYFLDEGLNPCSGEEGVMVMKLIDAFTKKDAHFTKQVF